MRLFTVSWDGTAVSAQKSAFVPDDVDPERVLADMQLALWPLPAVQAGFRARQGSTVSEPFAGVRRMRRGDALIAEVHYATARPVERTSLVRELPVRLLARRSTPRRA